MSPETLNLINPKPFGHPAVRTSWGSFLVYAVSGQRVVVATPMVADGSMDRASGPGGANIHTAR